MATIPMGDVVQNLRRVALGQDDGALTDGHLLEGFLTRRDEAAFEALVRRHGPMVLGVCRRILGHAHDAEDAFQTTFLVLFRKATTLRTRATLGNWLYGVAYHTALKARAAAWKRRAKERQGSGMPEPQAPTANSEQDWRIVLDHAVTGLPDRYRAALVLCELEGKTRQEAARQLGVPVGTLSGRLTTARRLLARRLARQGLPPPAGGVTAVVAQGAASAAVPPTLLATTVRAAGAAAGGALAGVVSTGVAALTDGVLQTMGRGKLKTATALVILGIVVGTGLAGLMRRRPAEAPRSVNAVAEPPVEAPAPPADPFGDPLPEEAVSRLGTIRLRDGGSVTGLAITPDGKTLVSESDEGVRTWDADTGKPLRHFSGGHRGGADVGASLSPDGTLLVTPGDDAHPIRIWDVGSGKVVREVGEKGTYTSVGFSSDGKRVAALRSRASLNEREFPLYEEQVQLWDATSGQPGRSWNSGVRVGKNGQSRSRPFWANEKTLLIASGGKVGVWDAETGTLRRDIEIDPVARPVAVSPDGALLATIADRDGGRTSCVRLVDVATGKDTRLLVVAERKPEIPPVWSRTFQVMAFARDGKTLVTASTDGTLIVWDLATGEEVRRYALGVSYPRALALSADGKTLAVARGSVVRLIDMATGKDRLRQAGHQLGLRATALSGDGRIAATACEKRVLLWDVATGRELRRLEDLPDMVVDIKMTGNGRVLLSLGCDATWQARTLQTWDVLTGKEVHRVEWHVKEASPPRLLGLSPDGKTAALGLHSYTKMMVLLDVTTGKELRRFDLEGEKTQIQGVAFSADGRTVLVWSSGDNLVRIRDVATGRQVRQFVMTDRYGRDDSVGAGYVAAVSPDGRHLVFGSQQPFLALYAPATGREIRRSGELNDNPDNGRLMVFAPDGKTLAWLGGDRRTVHLVERATFSERRRLVAPQGEITSLTFSADGKTLLAGNRDTTAIVWDLTGRLRDKAARGQPLRTDELDVCWADLAADDGLKVERAIRKLAGAPQDAIPYLRTRLRPTPAPDETRVVGLIAALDSEDFETREKATRELDALEEEGLGFYRKALEANPSAEVRRRLAALVEKYADPWRHPASGRLRALRSLEVLELAGTTEARQVLETLARGASGSWLTVEATEALDRLRRRSP
jgi:RNA polymerase sigma factor (sigma-70 family)